MGGGHHSDCGEHRPGSCSCMGSRMARFIEPSLLLLLLERPAHGYDLISRLQDFGFGEGQDPGMIYRNLRRLEDQRMIRSEWDTTGSGPARRFYEVTPEGRELIKAWTDTIRLNIATLNTFLDRFGKLGL